MRHLILTLSILVLTSQMAWARQNLRDIKSVDDVIFDVAVADEIRKKCPDISARLVNALSLYRSVRAQARSLGFSDEEIKAYGDSDVDKARIRAKGEAYLRANGVVDSDPQSYCALGRKEIQKSSRIGSLLKEK
jgi:capsule polysaccharide export protein KpsE/RkpR